jgi:hypothetical protein
MSRNVYIKLRTDEYSNWASVNPTPGIGEPCYDTTTKVLKIGDGSTQYLDLPGYAPSYTQRASDAIIGIEWDTGSSDPALRWIDINGNTVIPTETYWQTHPIFSQIVRVRLDSTRNEVEVGNGRGDGITLTSNYIMSRFPRIYVKYGKYTTSDPYSAQDDASGRYYRTWVSPSPYEGFHLDFAYYQQGYITPANYLYLGSFTANDEGGTTIGSRSGVASLVSTTMTNFYEKAQAIGTGWGITDIYDWGLIQRLFYIRFGNLNSQTILAPGATTSGSALVSGSAATLINVYGHGGGTSNQAMAVFGLENWWGNLWQNIIGLNIIGGGNIRIIKPDGTGTLAEQLAAGSYLETSGFTPVVASPAYPSSYLFVDPVKGLFLPSNGSGGSSSTYLCDGYYGANASGTTYILLSGGRGDDAALAGIGYLLATNGVGSVNSTVGARLRCLK